MDLAALPPGGGWTSEPLKRYLVAIKTHTGGRRVLKVSADSPAQARERAKTRKGVRNVVGVFRVR